MLLRVGMMISLGYLIKNTNIEDGIMVGKDKLDGKITQEFMNQYIQ